MNVQVVREDNREMELVIDNLTIASMVVHYLREDGRVEIAAFNQEHPLENKIKMFFRVKEGENPRKVLKEALEKAISDVSELRNQLLSSLS